MATPFTLERPLGNDDLTYTITSAHRKETFNIGDIIKIRITNITEDNKISEGHYYLASNSLYCELPYLCIRILAKKILCVSTAEVECIESYVYPSRTDSNRRYTLKVEFLQNVTADRTRLLDSFSKERQIEGNMLYGKGFYAKAIKYYRNALGILGVHEDDEPTPESCGRHFDIVFKCLNNLSACYMQLEDYRNALDVLTKVKHLQVDNIKMLWRTGRACLKLGLLEEAKDALLQARESDPDSSVIKRDLKEACRKLEERQKLTGQFVQNVQDSRAHQLPRDYLLSQTSQSQSEAASMSGMSLDGGVSGNEQVVISVASRDQSINSETFSSSQRESEASEPEEPEAEETEETEEADEEPEEEEAEQQAVTPRNAGSENGEDSSNEASYEVSESTQVSVVGIEQNSEERAGYLIMDEEPSQSQQQVVDVPAGPVLQLADDEDQDEDSDAMASSSSSAASSDHEEESDKDDQDDQDGKVEEYPDDFEPEPQNTTTTEISETPAGTTTITKTTTTSNDGYTSSSVFTSTTTTTSYSSTVNSGDVSSIGNIDLSNFGSLDISKFGQIGSINEVVLPSQKEPAPEPEPIIQTTGPVLVMDQNQEDPEPEPVAPKAADDGPVLVMDREEEPQPEPEPQVVADTRPVLQMVEDSQKPQEQSQKTRLISEIDQNWEVVGKQEIAEARNEKTKAQGDAIAEEAAEESKAQVPTKMEPRNFEAKGEVPSQEAGLNLPLIIVGLGALVGLGLFVMRKK